MTETLGPAMIHPLADVSPTATIGDGSRIWDLARIREGAVVGVECIVGRGAFIDVDVQIGNRVKIQNNALVYHGVRVASGVFIGPAAILTNDRFPRSVTLDGQLAGADDWRVSEIELEEGCSIGAGAVVVAGSRVGRYATVAAGAVVVGSVPEHALVAGVPAKRLGWVCRCGRRLSDAMLDNVGPEHAGVAVCAHDGSRYVVNLDRCTAEELS